MKKTVRKRRAPRIIAAALILLLAGELIRSNYSLETEYVTIALEGLPAGFEGFKIVQIADLHGKEFGVGNEKLFEEVRAAAPDIIVILGDIAENEKQIEPALALCRESASIAPTYYVSGNHEWTLAEPRSFFSEIEATGVILLDNDYVQLQRGEDSIILAGLGDPNGPRDQIDPSEFILGLPDGLRLVLYHRNTAMEQLGLLGADLILSGHAHGGLVRLPFTDGLIDSTRKLFPSHTNGLYKASGSRAKMFVSRGLGNAGGTVRFLNGPHLPVITLTSA